MIRRFAVAAMGFGWALAGAGPALAATCADVHIESVDPIPDWNPINPQTQEATFTARILRASNSTRSARLIFLDSDSSDPSTRVGGATGPRYRIINTASSATVSFPSGTMVSGQSVPTTSLPNTSSGDSVPVGMKIQILSNNTPTEDFIGGTPYSETLKYAIQCFQANDHDNGTDGPVTSGLTISLTIPKLASIVTASPVTINFGSFTTTSQQALVSVKSTSTLNVSVATANGSKMVLSGAGSNPPQNSVIPYVMTFNGAAITAATPLSNVTRAGVAGHDYPIVLSLPDGVPSGKLAGSYADTITLTITAGS